MLLYSILKSGTFVLRLSDQLRFCITKYLPAPMGQSKIGYVNRAPLADSLIICVIMRFFRERCQSDELIGFHFFVVVAKIDYDVWVLLVWSLAIMQNLFPPSVAGLGVEDSPPYTLLAWLETRERARCEWGNTQSLDIYGNFMLTS
jgi:hypothetical protein